MITMNRRGATRDASSLVGRHLAVVMPDAVGTGALCTGGGGDTGDGAACCAGCETGELAGGAERCGGGAAGLDAGGEYCDGNATG